MFPIVSGNSWKGRPVGEQFRTVYNGWKESCDRGNNSQWFIAVGKLFATVTNKNTENTKKCDKSLFWFECV